MIFYNKERLAVILSLFHLVFCGVENNTIDGEEQMEARDKRFIYGGAGNGGLPSSPQEINHLLLQVGGHGFNLQSEGGSVSLHAKAAEDIATEAAGRAHEAVAQQEAAAWKAAQEASQKIAEKASAEAQKAQAAAAEKYQQAASLTQAAQSAQVSAFTEAATAAQVGKTLQAVDILVEWALQQQHALTQLLATSEAQLAQGEAVQQALRKAYTTQAQQAWRAQQIAQYILQQQVLSIQNLESAQKAAQKAVSSAQKALYKAKGTARNMVYG